MAKQFTEEDDALLAELGVEVEAKKASKRTPREERIIAGFEEIQRFYDEHGRPPLHGEDRDIFERLYAVRLDRLREQSECWELLEPMDHHGLLGEAVQTTELPEELDDDALLAELGVEQAVPGSLTELRHVRSQAEIKSAEEIANREVCEDFEHFAPLFENVERELKAGLRQTIRFGRDASIDTGNFFILSGQMVYVAEMGEIFRTPNGEQDARLRAIYSNGTESNLLLRSLQRALYKDDTGRRITDSDAGPLFSGVMEKDDIESGTVYVLRSLSEHPFVAKHRELVHKIGVTGGKVETRIANAKRDATYLLADVEVVASFKLVDINRTRLEAIFHRLFAPAQLNLTINDRFGHPVKPREWFLVPLHVIDEAVQRVIDGTVTDVVYDPESAQLVSR